MSLHPLHCGPVSARRSPRFRFAAVKGNCLAAPARRALQLATFGAFAALGTLKAPDAHAAITSASDQPMSFLLGDQFAQDDLIRSTLFVNNDTGAIFRGNAMPLGQYYSGFSYHWITAIQGYWNTTNISISVGLGQDRTNPTNSTQIISLNRMPGQDFVIGTHASPFLGARMPEFWNAPLASDQIVTVVGFGPQQVWGSTVVSDNGHAQGVHMRVYDTTNPTDIGLTNDAGLAPDGGFINFNSSSVVCFFDQQTQMWRISAMIQTGTPIDPFTPEVDNGALDMLASGAATYTMNNTPLNSIPEPTSETLILATAWATALMKRRRRN